MATPSAVETQPGVFVRIAQKSDHLKDIFSSIIKGNEVVIHPQIVQDIFNKELQIKLAQLNEVLQCVLLESLVYFIGIWPGWVKIDDYRKGLITYDTWFDKFKQYLILQTKYVIKNEPQARSMAGDASSETHIVDGIAIYGPPAALDLDFKVSGSNLILNKAITLNEEEKITFRELINWPNSNITMVLGNLKIVRCLIMETTRFLAVPEKVPAEAEKKQVVLKGQVVNNSKFMLNSVREYLTRIVGILRFVIGYNGELTQVLNLFLNEIETIDVENERNIHGHAYFMKYKHKYQRTKFVKDSNVSLYEKFVPSLKYEFYQLGSVLDEKERKEDLRKIKLLFKNMQAAVQQIMMFTCTFCNYNNSSAEFITKHYVKFHGHGPSLKCSSCSQSFTVTYLSRNNWEHDCG